MAEPNNTLLQKLDGIDARFQEVSLLITDPAVIGDMKRFVKLTKEYKDLEKLTAVTSRYKKMLQNVEEAKAVLENESDPDLRELAKEELESDTNELPKIEEEIKLLLIPEDPEDSKNVILEIRGGTGGDEAAIFAGDLFQSLRDTQIRIRRASRAASACHRNTRTRTHVGRIRGRAAGSRTIRRGNQRRRNQMGHIPFGRRRRTKREQSGIRRPFAVQLEEPKHRHNRRNSDRMHRNSRPT